MPHWRATAPSWATAGPEPRATARASRGWANRAQPAARSRERISSIVPAGNPAAASAGATQPSTIASAVANASDPMRITTVLPLRTTPAASAKTLGRPSKTNPTTPSGARRASTRHPSCSTVPTGASRRSGESRQPISPATMSPRMRSVSTSRVVDRPERSAASTSARLAVSTCPITSASPRRAANPSKKDEICSSLTAPSASNAVRARAVASAAMAYWAAGTCSRSPVSPRAIKRSPAANASANSWPTVT